MSLSFALSQFLRAVDQHELLKPIPSGGIISRQDLLRLIRENVQTDRSPSEIIDIAAYEGLLDARNKQGPIFEDFFLTDHGREILSDPESFQVGAYEQETVDLIDSTDWTGLAKSISPAQKFEIRGKANELLSLIIQSDADEQTRLDACKRVEAVVCLLEAPNSPWRDIVSLLNHPSVTAFLAALNLIQFIIGIAK